MHTGDLGTMDSRGYVRITWRVKEIIIRGGENLFPAEVENGLREHPMITEVVSVGIPDDKWEEVVACFIRADATEEIDPKVLHYHCRQHLAPKKTPVAWCKVEVFPLTGSGKIQKFPLRDSYLPGYYELL